MSGQVVVAPAVILVGGVVVAGAVVAGTLLAGGLATYGVVKGVQIIVDARLEAARREIERERTRIAEWRQFQCTQFQRMQDLGDLERSIQNAEKRLEQVRLADRAPEIAQDRSRKAGYTALGKRERNVGIADAIEEVIRIIEGLPRQFREADASPYPLLEKQCQILHRKAGDNTAILDEIVSFRETVGRTLDSFMKRQEATRRRQAEMAERLEKLLGEVVGYVHLAPTSQLKASVENVMAQMTALLTSSEIRPGFVDLVEQHLRRVQYDIDCSVLNAAHRAALGQAVTRHLDEMGYEVIRAFDTGSPDTHAEAMLRMPGGERISIVIHGDNRLGFELLHEMPPPKTASAHIDLDRFRAQERKWCQDFKELIRALVADGFDYKVAFERPIPLQEIKVVVFETPDEILGQSPQDDEEDFAYEEPKRMRST